MATRLSTTLSTAEYNAVLRELELSRRRQRVEQGRSPVQLTVRSENKGREAKRPGKGHRQDWKRGEW